VRVVEGSSVTPRSGQFIFKGGESGKGERGRNVPVIGRVGLIQDI